MTLQRPFLTQSPNHASSLVYWTEAINLIHGDNPVGPSNHLRVHVLVSFGPLGLQLFLVGLRASFESLNSLFLLSPEKILLALELAHGDRRQNRGAVVLGLGVMRLVDGYRRMNVLGHDCFLLDDRLDVLMDVMVHVFAGHCGCDGSAVGSFVGNGGVFELRCFGVQLVTEALFVAVVDRLVLYGKHVVRMALGSGERR